MKLPILCSLFAIFAAAASSSIAATSPASGYQSQTAQAAPGGTFLGGMDFLPNGNLALFNGSAIVEVDPQNGSMIGTLYTPPGFVFGSFVKVAPSGSFLLFGESSNHQIIKVPLGGGGASVVATVTYNFDLAFESDAIAFVSASPTWGQNLVLRLDIATGATDVIADLVGASGAIAVDASGALYYGEASTQFPSPPSTQNVLKFDPAAVASAIGPTSLTTLDATPIITSFTTINDIALDNEGDLIVVYDPVGFPSPTFVREFGPDGTPKALITETLPGHYGGPLAFRRAPTPIASAFGPFQPASGGTLAVITTDFFSFNDVDLVTPRRAELATTPTNPIPQGSFTFTLTGGPANGTALIFVAGGGTSPEIPVFYQGVPFLFGIQPGTIALMVPVPLDASGNLSIPALHHGSAGTVYVQAALLDNSSTGVGTTTTLAMVLQ